ncbi:MAG: DNA primase family protein [Halobacteriota archaeon]
MAASEVAGISSHAWEFVDRISGERHDVIVYSGFHPTDEGNAQRLKAYYGDYIRYCADTHQWHIWDDIRWGVDTTGYVYELAKDTARLIYAEASFVEGDTQAETKQLRKEVQKWASQSESLKRIKAMVEMASTMQGIAVTREEFDAKRELINCPNGTLDLKRREFREHRQEDMLTMVTSVPYIPMTCSPYFYPTLLQALPYEEAVYLQRMLGSMLEGTTKNKEYLMIYGKPYAGKSSITQAVYAALGDYAKPFPAEMLMKTRHGVAANAAHPEYIALQGVRIAWTEELSEGFVINDAVIKSMTSSGVKSTRDVFERQRTLQLVCSFVIETNGVPVIDVKDEWQRQAILDRTNIVPFLNTVPVDKRKSSVLKSLTENEEELIVALAWVVQGFFDRQDNGLPVPDGIRQQSNEYQRKVNPLYSFVTEEVVLNTKANDIEVATPLSDLFERFKETADNDIVRTVKGSSSFNAHFRDIIAQYAEEQGVEVRDRRKSFGMEWVNVSLRDQDDKPADLSIDDGSSGDNVDGVANDRFGKNCHDITLYYKLSLPKGEFATLPTPPRFPTILVEGLSTPSCYNRRQGIEVEESLQNTASLLEVVDSPSPPDELKPRNCNDTGGQETRLKPISDLIYYALNELRRDQRHDYTEGEVREAVCNFVRQNGYDDRAYVVRRYDDELSIDMGLDDMVMELTKDRSEVN